MSFKNLELFRNIEKCQSTSKIDKALEYYYDSHDPSLKKDAVSSLENSDIEKKKRLLKILAKECINRDMISQITTGNSSDSSKKMNEILM